MQIWRLGGCEDFVSEWEECVFDVFGYFEQWREHKIGVMWQDLFLLPKNENNNADEYS